MQNCFSNVSDKHILNGCCIPAGKTVVSIPTVSPSSIAGVSVSHTEAAPPDIKTVCIGDEWFNMGSTGSPHPEDGEGPVRKVWVDEFKMAIAAISNKQFHHFAESASYVTDAERVGSSFVFHLLLEDAQRHSASSVAPWWLDVHGANWRNPEGPDSSIEDRWDHPVVHVTRNDALQYCQWAGTCLPTEAQWEFAARGGLASQPYPWGAQLTPNGVHSCNIWQGDFPNKNDGVDGFVGTAPVTQYTPNLYGLFNMTGNVWEWVADRFTHMHSPRAVKNPTGPLNGERYVAKGGSYLCHESYCLRYRTSSRQALLASVSTGNVGFRVSLSVE